MIKRLTSMVLSLALTVTMVPQGVFAVAENDVEGAVESDGIIVVFDKSAADSKIKSTIESSDAETEQIMKIGGEKLALATVGAGDDPEAVMEGMDKNTKVLYTQPNYVYEIKGEDPYLLQTSTKYQYQHKMMKVKEAWDLVAANKTATTKVAVLDTGADVAHEDLAGMISRSKHCVAGEVVDDNTDTASHGTHVTGIIGAKYGNSIGGAGVASGYNNDYSDIMSVAVSEDGYRMTTYNIVAGIKYAAENGAKVANMSFGDLVRDRITNAVIKWAHYEKGMIFVAAAGNETSDAYAAPSDIKEVISVCNCARNGIRNSSTNFGLPKDITAPGTSITSTVPNGLYSKYSGTSMASPMVAGVCALMLDVNPNLTQDQVRNIICATAVKDCDGSDNYYIKNGLGYGLVDAQAAVNAAIEARDSATESVTSLEIKKDEKTPIFVVPAENPEDGKVIYDGIVEGYEDVGVGLETIMEPAHTSAKVTWTSDNPDIAEVDPATGNLVGKTPGETTTIRATAGDKTDTCTVQVVGTKDPSGVVFDLRDKDKVMYVGESSDRLANYVTILPKDASSTELYWKSSDTNVLTVDDMGFLTARSVGEATITATTCNGKASEGVTIKVIRPPAKVEITKSETWLKVGEKAGFKAVVKDDSGKILEDCKVTWESGNKYLASTNDKGEITAKAAGGVYIFAKVTWDAEEPGEISAYKKITITKKNYSGKDYALKCTKVKAKNVKLAWKKIPKVTGYELYRATKKKGKYSRVKTLAATKNTFTDKKAKVGKTYFYKVRAKYKKSGKTGLYGYSNIVKAKIKKTKVKKAKKSKR